MATTAPAGPEERLDSWKEIAAYLKRGVRTVQRWERSSGLPVHRLELDRQGAVFAYKPELDAWWESRRQSGSAVEAVEEELASSQAGRSRWILRSGVGVMLVVGAGSV
jgi:hypothetical protein